MFVEMEVGNTLFRMFVILNVWTAASAIDSSKTAVVEEEVCQTEYFKPSCAKDEVVVVESAQYGRLQLGRCVTEDFGFIGCMHDVKPEVEAACSGRHSCEIRIDDTAFKRATPCHKDLKNHLWIGYRCSKVVLPATPCHFSGETTVTVATATNHALSSQVTEETGCGTADSPWIIQAGSGQRINLTLYDFSMEASLAGTNGPSKSWMQGGAKTCRVLVTIRENPELRSSTVCAGQARVMNILTSSSNKVELRLLVNKQGGKSGSSPSSQQQQQQQQQSHFLVEYQALGCSDPPVLQGMRLRRVGDLLSIDCGTDGDPSWQMTCVDNAWIGSYNNCSKDSSTQLGQNKYEAVLPYATSVIIIAVIAVSIVCFILTAGILCIKWRLRQDYLTRYPTTELSGGMGGYDYSTAGVEVSEKYPAQTGNHGTLYPAASDISSNANEYATMRLLQTAPGYGGGCGGGEQAGGNSVQYGYRLTYAPNDHIYESPETMRRDGGMATDRPEQPITSRPIQYNLQRMAGSMAPSGGGQMDDLASTSRSRFCGANPSHRYESPSREQQRTLANTTGNYSL